jgi:oligopeptidase B
MENWVDVIPHPEVLLEGFEIFKNYLVLEEREEGLLQIKIIDEKTQESHYLPFSDPTYTAYIGLIWNLIRKFYAMAILLTQPSSTYEYNMKEKTTKLLKQQEVLGGKFLPKIIFPKESGQIPETEKQSSYFSGLS